MSGLVVIRTPNSKNSFFWLHSFSPASILYLLFCEFAYCFGCVLINSVHWSAIRIVFPAAFLSPARWVTRFANIHPPLLVPTREGSHRLFLLILPSPPLVLLDEPRAGVCGGPYSKLSLGLVFDLGVESGIRWRWRSVRVRVNFELKLELSVYVP